MTFLLLLGSGERKAKRNELPDWTTCILTCSFTDYGHVASRSVELTFPRIYRFLGLQGRRLGGRPRLRAD